MLKSKEAFQLQIITKVEFLALIKPILATKVTRFCSNLSIQYSGTTNLLPKTFDIYLNTIL